MNHSRPARRDASRALYLELAARGVSLRTGRVPETAARRLWEHVRADGAGLREVLVDAHDLDVLAVRREAGNA